MAGDAALFEEVRERVLGPVLWSPPGDGAALAAEIGRMRDRIESELGKEAERGPNPKSGRGGLIDVEFATQFLQLAHGHAHPALRTTSTPAALDRLREAGILREPTYRALSGGYEFLRRLDLRLRIVHDYTVDHLPRGGPALTQLARRLGHLGDDPAERAHGGVRAGDGGGPGGIQRGRAVSGWCGEAGARGSGLGPDLRRAWGSRGHGARLGSRGARDENSLTFTVSPLKASTAGSLEQLVACTGNAGRTAATGVCGCAASVGTFRRIPRPAPRRPRRVDTPVEVRHRGGQSCIWAPISTTRFGGSLKKELAVWALRAIMMKRRLRQAAMRAGPVGSRVSRPR